MKICAISDIHGNLLTNIPECDILCICGDIINLNDQRNLESSRKWLYTRFSNWVIKQKCEKVIIIPGNHDFLIEDANKNKYIDELKEDLTNRTNGKLVLLINETYNYNNVNFYGCPYINPIGFQEDKWAFSTRDENLYKIPENTDILLTHDNPYKNFILYQNLSEHIKFHFYGHWHDGKDDPKEGRYNCSILNDYYNFKKDYNFVLINFEKNMDIKNKIDEISKEIENLNTALEADRDENTEYLDKCKNLRDWLVELLGYISPTAEAVEENPIPSCNEEGPIQEDTIAWDTCMNEAVKNDED